MPDDGLACKSDRQVDHKGRSPLFIMHGKEAAAGYWNSGGWQVRYENRVWESRNLIRAATLQCRSWRNG